MLYTGASFDGSGRMIEHDVVDFGTIGMNDAVRSLIVTQVHPSELSGIVLCTHSDFAGQCKFFGTGQHADLGELRNQVSSMYLTRPGFVVHLHEKPHYQGQTWRSAGNVTDFSTVASFNDNVESIQVTITCDPSCGSHGDCVGPNTCRCKDGWEGPTCSIGPPDETSGAFCEQ